MKTYTVTVTGTWDITVDAQNPEDAEDMAYKECLEKGFDIELMNLEFEAFNEEDEQIFLVVPTPEQSGVFYFRLFAGLMIVFYRVRGGQDGEDFFDLVEACAWHFVLDDSFLMRTGRRHGAL